MKGSHIGTLADFRIGISDRVNTALPVWMAQHAGFFAKEGLSVHIDYPKGGSAGAEQLQDGHLDLMRVGFSSVLRINKNGGHVACVASMSNVMRFTVFSASGVETAADLKGAAIGVSTFGSETDTAICFALRRLGLSRDDVIVKEYGDAARRLAALMSGEIKASAINEPVASQARAMGVNVLADLAGEDIPWLFSGVVVRTADLDERRPLLRRFLRAMIEGNFLAISDERQAKDVLGKELMLSDPHSLDINYDDFRKQAPLEMKASLEGAQNVFATLFPGEPNVAAKDIDNTIVEELEQEGFFSMLRARYEIAES